ncbi:MAG: hypothetical protein ABIU63_13025 [Chitinophagaceae bacterium]
MSIKKGADINTLLDDCDREIPEGHELPFTVAPLLPTPLDSISPVKCAPGQLELVFTNKMRCSSVAADGSDFVITGPAPVTISSAAGVCDGNDLTSTIVLKLSAPVVNGGVYKVSIRRGSDFNNIIDACGQETPLGSSTSFEVKDTVSADFAYTIFIGCKEDTVVFAHNGNHQVNQWLWIFDAAGASNTPGKSIVFHNFGNKQNFAESVEWVLYRQHRKEYFA